jgi:dynein assembly factor 2
MGIQAQQTQDTSRQTSSNNAKDVPSEKEFSDLFEEAMHRSSNIKTEITQDEQQKFLKAMKDPDFRSLLNDYMKEISDPSNREETERYLAQLEGENKVPEDKILIQPTPGFVTKTIWEDEKQKQKVFVNICTSAKINPPSSTKVEATKHTKAGSSWSLPYSAGPERVEKDHGMVVNIVFYMTSLAY